MTVMFGIADAEFLRAVATVLAGVLIFLTLETRIVPTSSNTENHRGVEEQQKVKNINQRIKDAEQRRHRYIVIETVEGKILLAMFALMLTSIGLIVLGTEPSKVLDLALLARIFFVLSLVCLIVRIYLHGKE